MFFNSRVMLPLGTMVSLLFVVLLFAAVSLLPRAAMPTITLFSPHVEGEYQEFKGKRGPEGDAPRPPNLQGPIKIYVLQEGTRRVVELRDQTGAVIAKVTSNLSRISDLYADWKGPEQGWCAKVETAATYEGYGLAQWLWRFSDRIFFKPGEVQVIIDVSKTSTGRTGWTTANVGPALDFFSQNIGSVKWLSQDPDMGIWIYQAGPLLGK